MKNGHLLNQCTPNLRRLFLAVDEIVQVEVLPSTIRTAAQQKEFLAAGTSKTLVSKHLLVPSQAVDAGPYPHRWPQEGAKDFWKDWARLYYFAGVVVTMARQMEIKIRYGGDWNGNFELKDENFFDGVHFEEM